jgi:type IV pilus assembly protein PilV
MIVRNSDRYGMTHSRGFTLIEVLVAIIVLAIGLLGLAGLQLTSLKAADSAYFRSQATLLADDILDRMRSNRTAALAGNYDIDIDDTRSGTSVADLDLIEWKVMLGTTLTEGDGSVDVDANDIATITIQWNDARAGGGTTQQFTVISQL